MNRLTHSGSTRDLCRRRLNVYRFMAIPSYSQVHACQVAAFKRSLTRVDRPTISFYVSVLC